MCKAKSDIQSPDAKLSCWQLFYFKDIIIGESLRLVKKVGLLKYYIDRVLS